MLNLIKMDLHRLFRIKSFWVMIAVTVFVSFFSVYMTHYDAASHNDVAADMTDISVSDAPHKEVDVVFGVAVDTKAEWADRLDFTDLVNSNFAGQLLAILCVIFPPIFVNGEQKNGYIKNIAGQLHNRGMLVLSKLTAVAVQVLIIFAVFILSAAIMGKICWGDKLVFESVSNFAKILGIHYLLHFAFASLVTALTILIRGSGFSMTFGILCSTGITSLLYAFADILLYKCGVSEEFTISNYFIENCIAIVSPDLSGGDLTRVIAVGAVFIVISTLISMTVMQKRDIR